MTRVAFFAHHNFSLFHALNTQSRISDFNVQLASGKKSQHYSGISQEAGRLLSSEITLSRTQQFIDNIDLANQRLELMDLAVDSIEGIGRDLRQTLDAALSAPEAFKNDLPQLATNMRLLVTDALNTRDGDRYLFGGTRSDRQPVDLQASSYTPVSLIESDGTTVDETFYQSYYTDVLGNTLPYAQGTFYQQIYFEKNGSLPTGPLPGDLNNPTLNEFVAEDPNLWQYYVDRLNSTEMKANPKTDYYNGNQQAQGVRTDDNSTLTYDVRADQLAFQQLLTALDAMANIPNGDTNNQFQRVLVQKAYEMVNLALEATAVDNMKSIDRLRSDLATPRQAMDFARERHDNLMTYTEAVAVEIEGVDQAELIVKLQEDQLTLEASFSSLARLQQLSLVNFI